MLGNEVIVASEEEIIEPSPDVAIEERPVELLLRHDPSRFAETRPLLTIADGLLGCILLMASVLLFAQMDALPLSSAEALNALPVYQFANGHDFTINSPAYFTLTALLSPFIGYGDVGVRAIPALFGLLAVGLPWLLRKQIGTIGALIAALLFAVSPTTNALTHLAGGESIAIFAAFLMFVAWVNWGESADNRWLLTLTIAAALGMASAPLFYSLLLTGAISLAIGRVFTTNSAEVDEASFDHAIFRIPLIVGGVVLVSLSTIGLAVPSGLGAVANVFGEWLGQFRLGSGWSTPLLALLRYEIIPLLLGIIAISVTLLTNERRTKSLLFWVVSGLILTLLQAGTVENVIAMVLPLFLLIGYLAARIFEKLAARGMWLIAVATFTWGVIALVNFGRFIKNPANIAAPFIAITLLLVLIFSVGYFLPHLPTVSQAFLLGTIAIWAYIGWGTAWTLTHRTGNDPRELWVTEGVDSDIKLMRETLQEASFQLVNSNSELELLSTVDHPALRWYLRDFENVEFVAGIPVGSSAEGLITPASETPSLSGNYAKATFDFSQSDFATVEEEPLLNILRYWFFGQSNETLQPEQLDVWLKLD